MTWREISAEEVASLSRVCLIDVRSPCEYLAENIPGSHNVPLFTDGERAEIGTIYAQEGEMVARRKALKIISPKISDLVEEIAALRRGGAPLVVHCWRGGLRSEAVASCLSIVGIDCWRLTGGYKAFRRHIIAEFEAGAFNYQAVVIDGLTGSGKTELLAKLSERGQPVVDLEKLANHRGSIFGALGLAAQPSQKNFEGELFFALKQLKSKVVANGYYFVEAESRKIGRLRVPDFLYLAIQNSTRRIIIESNSTLRAERILHDYLEGGGAFEKLPYSTDELLLKAIELLGYVKGLSKELRHNISEQVNQGKLREAVELMLQNYYDPLYSRHFVDQPLLKVDGADLDRAAEQILQCLESEFRV
ncbi:MAG: tRNA 2-selenouridine(34) synthase MnmH [Candidatus Obscuribacterales bacterium]|nr:tRNA 2-selenouridine(34) synthase MnmH [Candidatus Obscuribacterales bacterium]